MEKDCQRYPKIRLSLKKAFKKFIRPYQNRVYNCHNSKVIKFLTRLKVGLSYLCKHKFKHSFKDTLKSALSGLRQFLANESPLKMIKIAFRFTLKALFILKIFEVLP